MLAACGTGESSLGSSSSASSSSSSSSSSVYYSSFVVDDDWMPITGANTLADGTTVTVSGTAVFSDGTTSIIYDGTGYIAYIATPAEREADGVEIATGDTVKVHGAVIVADTVSHFDATATVTVTKVKTPLIELPDSDSYKEFNSKTLPTYETADGNDVSYGISHVLASVAADGSIAGIVDGLDSTEKYLDLIPGEGVSFKNSGIYDVLGISGPATTDTVAIPLYVVSAAVGTATVAQANAMSVDNIDAEVSGLTVAIAAGHVIIGDETGYFDWFAGDVPADVEVGNITTVDGVISNYLGFNRFDKTAVDYESHEPAKDEAPKLSDPVVWEGADLDAYAGADASAATSVSIDVTVGEDGTVTVEGATSKTLDVLSDDELAAGEHTLVGVTGTVKDGAVNFFVSAIDPKAEEPADPDAD